MTHAHRSRGFQLYPQGRRIRWMALDGLRPKRQARGLLRIAIEYPAATFPKRQAASLALAAALLATTLPSLSASASTSADTPDMSREQPGIAIGQAPANTAPSAGAAPAFASPSPLHDDEVPSAQADEIIRSPRFRQLAHELRCLVCQNQTLLDSHAPLAQDLRNEVVRLIASGRNDEQVKQYLVDRYGEFVLYRPSWSWQNALLWFGPVLMLLVALTVGWRFARRGQAQPAHAADGAALTTRPTSHEADHHAQVPGIRQHPTSASQAGAAGAAGAAGVANAAAASAQANGAPPSSHAALAEIDALLADDDAPTPAPRHPRPDH